MPKTLAEIDAGAWAYVHPLNSLNIETEVMARIADFLWKSTQIDVLLTEIMAQAAGPSAAPLIADIYESLHSSQAQKDALTRAILHHLNDDQADMFEAIAAVARDAQKPRNIFAHHLYCYSPAIASAVLLLDPKVWIRFSVVNFAKAESLPGNVVTTMALSPEQDIPQHLNDQIRVYTKWDVIDAIALLTDAAQSLRTFKFSLLPDFGTMLYGSLLAQPAIRDGVERAKKRRRNGPSRQER